MGFEAENEANATPKLSLSKLPSKQREPLVIFTPPISTLASIPFQWEEAPGKPRADLTTSSPPKKKNSVARCLHLPPRLLNTTNSSNDHPNLLKSISLPTTVLEGPYSGQFFSHNSSTFSLPKGSFKSLEEEIVREVKYHHHHHGINEKTTVINERYPSLKFASWRWGSYKENSGRFAGDSFDFTSSVSFASKSHRSSANAKPPRIRRRSSFLSLSQASSNILVFMEASSKWSLGDVDKSKRKFKTAGWNINLFSRSFCLSKEMGMGEYATCRVVPEFNFTSY